MQHSTPLLSSPDSPIAAVLKRSRLFGAVFLLSLLLITIVVLSLPKKYECRMELLVKNGRQELIVSPASNSSTVQSPELSETQVNSEIELIRSRDVLREVVLKSGLDHGGPGTVMAAGEPSWVAVDNAMDSLQRHLQIDPIKKTDVIRVSYTSRSPEVAYGVMKRLADTYLAAHLKVHGSPGTYSFFDVQAESYHNRLANAEGRLRNFRERYAAVLAQSNEHAAFVQRAISVKGMLEEADVQIADYERRVSEARTKVAGLDERVVTEMKTSPQQGLIQRLTDSSLSRSEEHTV